MTSDDPRATPAYQDDRAHVFHSWSAQATLDPLVITGAIFENLVEYDQDGVLKPQLAKALPEISADKLIYTFDLRDDVQFHNGQQMTAEDVKYSFDSMLDPKRAAARRGVFSRIDRVEIDTPMRVRVHLKEPYTPWVYFLTKYMGIWPKDSREKLGERLWFGRPEATDPTPAIVDHFRLRLTRYGDQEPDAEHPHRRWHYSFTTTLAIRESGTWSDGGQCDWTDDRLSRHQFDLGCHQDCDGGSLSLLRLTA